MISGTPAAWRSCPRRTGIDACSGDSGGPRFVIENDAPLLLGNIAGGSCDGRSGAGVIGFTGMSYRQLANRALEAAGLPTIPSQPRDLQAARVEGSTTLWWQPPADSVQTVVGYDVLDRNGALLCTTAETVCTFPTGATGTEDMSVRARNVQGEGDANLAPDADMLRMEAPKAKVLKAKTKKKPVRIRFSPADYPAVTEYRVTTPKGEPVCMETACHIVFSRTGLRQAFPIHERERSSGNDHRRLRFPSLPEWFSAAELGTGGDVQ
jgi:hypothetical protein